MFEKIKTNSRMFRRRFTAAFLAWCMAVSLFPVTALAEPENQPASLFSVMAPSLSDNGSTFTIRRTGDVSQAATVGYRTVDGTAIGGTHYKAVDSSISFAPYQTVATVTVDEYSVSRPYITGGKTYAATAYQNSDRTYYFQIYSGASVLAEAMRSMTMDGNTVSVSGLPFSGFEKKDLTLYQPSSNKVYDGSSNKVYFRKAKDSHINPFYIISPVNQLSLSPSTAAYLNALGVKYRVKLELNYMEEDDGYQFIWMGTKLLGETTGTTTATYESTSPILTDSAMGGSNSGGLYSASFENLQKVKTSLSLSFPHIGGSESKKWEVNGPQYADGQSGDYLELPLTETVFAHFGASGNDGDKWLINTAASNASFQFIDTRSPQLVGAVQKNGHTSLIFDEMLSTGTNVYTVNTTGIVNYSVTDLVGNTTNGSYTGSVMPPEPVAPTVTEQFSGLTVGETYYFDLSGPKIRGTTNTELPDTSLKWVPFTYAGTVNAYNLVTKGLSVSTDSSVSLSNRSLFIADYNVKTAVSWHMLHQEEDAIFGMSYSGNGVSYKLRAPSVGSGNLTERGDPQSNEWDRILDKGVDIPNWSLGSWGQDTYENDSTMRTCRGGDSVRNCTGKLESNPWYGYRPVLEIQGTDDLRTVVLNLNGKTFNEESVLYLAAGNSSAITVPAAPVGDTFYGWNTAKNGDGINYAVGESIPSSVSTLYAQWSPASGTATVTLNKDNSTWSNHGRSITLRNGSATITNLTAVPNGTYDILVDDAATGSTLTISGGTASTTIYYYTVTFYDDAAPMGTPAQQIVLSGRTATNPEPPTKAGFAFEKWVTEHSGSTEVDFTTAITSQTNVYAKWTPTQITLSPTSDTVTETVLKETTADNPLYNLTAKLTTGNDAETGSVQYLVTSNNLPTGLNLADGKIFGKPTIANPDGVEVVIQVTGKNGSKADFRLTIKVNKESQSAPTTPTGINPTVNGKKDGKITGVTTDMEWKKSSDPDSSYTKCTGTEISNLTPGTYQVRMAGTDTKEASEPKTITIAESTTTLTVTYASQEGSAVASATGLSYEATLTEPAAPTRSGYDFTGWYKEAACTNKWAFGTGGDKVTGNITLYAGWQQQPQTAAPSFGSASYTMASSSAQTAEFTLSGTAATTYKVYDAATGGNEITGNPAVAVENNKLKLTFDTAPTTQKIYYVSAKNENETESTRTALTVNPFVNPSVTLGSDKEVTVKFAYGDSENTTKSDSINITTTAGTATSTFAASDFSISSSNTTNTANTAISGVSVTAIGNTSPGDTTLTIGVAKGLSAGNGYLWYGGKSVGQITFAKTVEQASTNAYLSGLEVTGGSLKETFNKDTLAYTMDVDSSVGSITVTPTVQDTGKAMVTVNNTTVNSGSASQPISLSPGANTITVKVTAQDGATTKEYTITVTRANASHAITIGTIEHGSVSASSLNAEERKTVTLTAKPEANYELESIAVTKTGGSETIQTTLSEGENKYTFIMPDYAVTVTAVFKPIAVPEQSTEPAFSENSYTKESANENTATFTLTTAAAATAIFKVYTDADGDEIPSGITATANERVLTLNGISGVTTSTDYYITATEQDKTESSRVKVTVNPYTPPTPTRYNVTYTLENLTAENQATSVESEKSLSVILTAANGYKLPDSITVTMGGSTLTSGSGYTYNSTTGTVTVQKVTGAVVIQAEGVQKSTAKQITGFTIPSQTGQTKINQSAHTINVTMPEGASLTSLIPAITISEGAAISPASGEARDFTNSVTYTVTAEDESTQNYTVTVTAEQTPIRTIDTVNVTGITTPVAGNTPDTQATNGTHWTGGTVSWNPEHTTFEYETVYTASVEVTAADGYEFTEEVTATVEGENAKVTRNSDTSITVSYDFPETEEAETASFSDAEYVEKAVEAVEGGTYAVEQSTSENEDSFLTELANLINKILERLFGAGNTERITTGDIDSMITDNVVAGDEENPDGIDGGFTFSVEIHKGEESTTVEDLTGTIRAAKFTDEEQKQKDREAVDAAIEQIEGGIYNIPQSKARTEAVLKSELKNQAKSKAGNNVTVNDIQITEVELAVAGTKDNPDGTSGSFTFKACVSKGSIKNIWTDELGGTILPEEYVLKKPSITTGSLPDGTAGEAYEAELKAESDTAVTWAVSGGSLPEGISLDTDGTISGTPETAGTYTVTVSAENGSEQGSAEKTYTITVNEQSGKTEHTITASAGAGGTISPSGAVIVADGANQSFTITAADGYYVSDVLADGISVGRQTSYEFKNVTGNHTIEAVFTRGSIGPNGGGSSGGGDGSSSNSSSSPATTTTSTTTTEDGGQVTTSVTADSKTGQTVTTEVKKDAAGNITGVQASVGTSQSSTSVTNGQAQISTAVDGNLVNQAVNAAESPVPVGISVDMPNQELAAQFNNPTVQNVTVDLIIPDVVTDNGKINVNSIIIDKATIEAAKAAGKDLTVTVKDEKGNVDYAWIINGQELKDSAAPATEMNLALSIVPVKTLSGEKEKIKAVVAGIDAELKGLNLGFSHAGILPSIARVSIPASNEAGIKPGDTVYMYYYNPANKNIEALSGNQYTVGANGYVTVSLDHCSDYVLLPKNVDVPQAKQGGSLVHTIKKGDTLNKISRQYGCKVADLLALNPGVEIYDLRIGSGLILPVS